MIKDKIKYYSSINFVRKRLIAVVNVLVTFVFASVLVLSNSITISSFDYTAYPNVKVKFFPLDDSGEKKSNLNANQFSIFENGASRSVISFNCSNSEQPVAVSSVLTIDVSSSMEGAGIALANAAAKEWLSIFPYANSECAITTFNHLSYINQDFTSNKINLEKSLANLKADGGTNYSAALLDTISGAINLAKFGNNKKFVLMLTDGVSEVNQEEAISKAIAANIAIYAVVIGFEAPASLKNICISTGGRCADNIQTLEGIKSEYRKILMETRAIVPCELIYKSAACAGLVNVNLTGGEYGYDKTSFILPSGLAPKLNTNDAVNVNFGVTAPSVPVKYFPQLKAENSDLFITGYKSSNPEFKVLELESIPNPILLKKDSIFNITIQYTPKDDKHAFAEITINSSLCDPVKFYIHAGNKEVVNDKNIRVVSPNGGEIYLENTIIPISWSGVGTSDSIKIEISNDSKKWNIITKTNGLKYNWKAPFTNSNTNLVRVSRYSKFGNYDKILTYQDFTSNISSLDLNTNGSMLAQASGQTVKLRNLFSGALDRSDALQSGEALRTRFNTMDSYYASVSGLETVKAWNAYTTDKPYIITITDKTLTALDWKYGDNQIALGTSTGEVYFWNIADNTTVKDFRPASSKIVDIKWSPDNSKLAIGFADGTLGVFNPNTGVSIISPLFYQSGKKINSLSWSANSSDLAIASDSSNLFIWQTDINSPKLIIDNNIGGVQRVFIFPNNERIAMLTSGIIKIYSLITAQEEFRYVDDNKIIDMSVSKDGLKIAAAFADGKVKILKLADMPYDNYTLEIDSSDAVWTIAENKYALKNVDFSNVEIGSFKEITVAEFAQNMGLAQTIIDSVRITGTDVQSFYIIKPFRNDTLVPGATKDLEIGFKPKNLGSKTAKITLYSVGKTFEADLNGIGALPKLTLESSSIVFPVTNLKDTSFLDLNLLFNASNVNITLDSIVIQGGNNEYFLYISSIPKMLTPGEYLSAKLGFTPREVGKSGSAIKYYYSGLKTPIIASLYGVGVSSELTVQNTKLLQILACPGNVSTDSIKIKNSGLGSIKLSNITIPSPNFTIKNTDLIGSLLTSQEEKYIIFTYKALKQGLDSVLMTIETNLPNPLQNTKTVNIKIIADTASLSLMPNKINFLVANENEPKSEQIEIRNTGTIGLSIKAPIVIGKFSIESASAVYLNPGETCTANVVFAGALFNEKYSETFRLFDSCGSGPELALNASVAGPPSVAYPDKVEVSLTPCDPDSKSFIVSIENLGPSSLQLKNAQIIGTDRSKFEILNFNKDTVVDFGKKYELTVKFKAGSEGVFNANCIISSNAKNVNTGEINVRLIGNSKRYDYSLETDTLYFKDARRFAPLLKSIKITNTGSYPVKFKYANTEKFQIVEINPNVIQPGEIAEVKVKFLGDTTGVIIVGNINFIDSCGFNKSFTCIANVIGPADAALSIGNYESDAGKTFEVPIILAKADQAIAGAKSLTAKIKVRSSLLYPDEAYPESKVFMGLRSFNVSLNPNAKVGEEIGRFRLLALLGDTNYSKIEIDEVISVSDYPIYFELNPGAFTLTGVCLDPKPRYIGDTGLFQLLDNFPNPAITTTKFRFNSIETGIHELAIYDLQGIKLQSVFVGFIGPGLFEFQTDISSLASGSYLFAINSPSQRLVKKFDIVK